MGLLVVPQSLARLHHRKDLTYRPVTDAPESRVALSWPEDATTDLVEDFIGDRPRPDRQQHPRPRRAPAPAQPKRKRPDAGGARRQARNGRQPPTGKAPDGSGGPKGGKRGKPRRRS